MTDALDLQAMGSWVSSSTRPRKDSIRPLVGFPCASASQGPSDDRLDIVPLCTVLEHPPERPGLTRRLLGVTRSARFLIRAPLSERDWRVPLERELGVQWRLDPTHQTEHTLESFVDEMAAACLTIKNQEVHWGEIWAEAVPGGS